MFCFHKYGQVQEDGFQYCKKCNKAITPKKECEHFWIIINEFSVKNTRSGNTSGIFYVLQCEHCGIIRKQHEKLFDY